MFQEAANETELIHRLHPGPMAVTVRFTVIIIMSRKAEEIGGSTPACESYCTMSH